LASRTGIRNAGQLRPQDDSYTREQRKYCEWVDDKRRDLVFPPEDKYITRAQVDCYYNAVVCKRMIQANSITRIGNALQRLADVEYAGDPDGFLVTNSNHVRQSIILQKDAYREMIQERSGLEDPLAGLRTNMMTNEEKDMFIDCVLSSNRPNWMPLCFSFTGCEATMCRIDSLMKFRLADAHVNDTHGPRKEGEYDREMLALAYQKGVHKENNLSKRVVGAWRHSDVFQCFVGHFSMMLFVSLLEGDIDISFTKPNVRDPPDWWKLLLLPWWENTTVANKAYTVILNEILVAWAKVCHMRRSGTEHASAVGKLSASIIATMTKHSSKDQSVLEKTYMTELHPSVCAVMSHTDEDDYFIARS
jgi:hypothetical protein